MIAKLVAATALLGLVLSACGRPTQTHPDSLTVLAAASLTETFTTLAATYESEHPGAKVKLVFESSATLAHMAEQHAPGDVLATADQHTMDQAVAKGGTQGKAAQFATNVMVLIVPSDNPAKIAGIKDLAKADFVTCVQTAPCGATAAGLLHRNQVAHRPVSEEVDVKSVLTKVTAGEADAGFVYATDALAAGAAVKSIDIPWAAETPNIYWIAVTATGASGPAKEWIALVTGSEGTKVLAAAGFGTS